MTLSGGTRLGSYEILAPLGAGGMGEVYRARDRKLDRDVAIKVLPESVAADPATLARFEREAKAVAALSHPNILSIHDFGTQDGVAYAVMELLEGDTLRGRTLAGPVSQKQAVDYALQIARGLSAAHERGVVHRDLKPENLWVTKDGHIKILDFGLAKRVEPVAKEEETSAPTLSGHTEPGKIMGTVGYMSPEQVRGLAADHRSDIFSFGAILYELLSGKRAFKRDTPSDTMAAILRDEPPELSESGRSVSPALDHIVKHCLEKDRDNRFQTAKDVVFALSEQSSATLSGDARPAARQAEQKNLVIVAAALVLLVAGSVYLLRRSPNGPAASTGVTRVAVLPFENLGAPEDDYFADGIADAVRGKLTSLPGLEVIARGSSTPYKKTTKTPQEIARELDVRYLLTATVRWQKDSGGGSRVEVSPELVEVRASGAPASKWQQPFDASLTDVFRVQAEIATQVARSLGGALGVGEEKRLAETPTANLAAYDAFLKAEEAFGFDAASLRKAVDLYEKAVALDPDFALAWARIAVVNSLRYDDFTAAPEVAERAREAAEKAVALAPDRPEGHHALGHYYLYVRRDPQRALAEYTKERRLAPGSPDGVRGIAFVDQMLGHWDEALEHSRQAERLDPRGVFNIRNLSILLSTLHRWSEARQVLDRGLALAPANLGLIQLKADTFLGEGDLSGARAFLKEAQSRVEPTALVANLAAADVAWVLDSEQAALLRRLTAAAFDDDEGTWAICQAEVRAFAGDAAGTQGYAERARKALEVRLQATPDDPSLRAYHALALAYLGRKEEAIRESERASALRPLTDDAEAGPYFRHQLARVYIFVGEPEKALDVLEPLLKVPYYLSPGWLKIDPNFDPLRKNPRFQKLVAGAK